MADVQVLQTAPVIVQALYVDMSSYPARTAYRYVIPERVDYRIVESGREYLF